MTSSSSPSPANPNVTVSAIQVPLPKPLHTQSPQTSSILHDPISQTTAIRHSDSSFSLYPSFSPLSSQFTPRHFPSQALIIPSPNSSATFLHLGPTPTITTLFLTCSPLLPQNHTLLRFHLFRDNRFVKIGVVSSHRDVEFDRGKGGVVFKVNHGVSMRLSGGVNVFTLYSVSDSRIWVFAVRLVEGKGGEEDVVVKLIKCTVIECCFRVFEVKVLFGVLVLGEENGVRVFALRPLVNGGKWKKEKKTGGSGKKGVKSASTGGELSLLAGNKGEKGDKNSDSVKMRLQKLRQDSKDVSAFFVAFEDAEGSVTKTPGKSVKAISVQALSANKFVVLDSAGNIHLLRVSYSAHGLNSPRPMQKLTRTMKVVKLAVFHDASTVSQTVWISDGSYTVNRLVVSDPNTPLADPKKKDIEEIVAQTSVMQTIFVSEKIKDVVPLASESMLVLGQACLLMQFPAQLDISVLKAKFVTCKVGPFSVRFFFLKLNDEQCQTVAPPRHILLYSSSVGHVDV